MPAIMKFAIREIIDDFALEIFPAPQRVWWYWAWFVSWGDLPWGANG